MATVKYHDGLEHGGDMSRAARIFRVHDAPVLDGAYAVQVVDGDTVELTASYDGASLLLTFLGHGLTGDACVVEEFHAFGAASVPLADFSGLAIEIDIGLGFRFGANYTATFAGEDVVEGNRYSDYLRGFAGNDLMQGLAGDDTLDGGAGVDSLYGGAGDDVYRVDSAADRVLEVRDADLRDAGGYDKVLSRAGFSLGSHVEFLKLLGGGNLHGYGNGLDNVIKGNRGANALDGGAGDDSIFGGAGDDRITGGGGRDMLVGGRGDDVFGYAAAAESGPRNNDIDEIADFVRGQDRIDLSMIDADSSNGAGSNDAFTVLIGASEAFSAPGQLRFEDGVLYGNTDGDDRPEFAIRLLGVTELSVADLVL